MKPHLGMIAVTAALAISALSPPQPSVAAEWMPPGPAIGATFSEPLALVDQGGAPRNLKALLGSRGAAVFFVRSADWCPFCKRQLTDVNQRLAEFTQLGYRVISVSMDTVDKVAEFHRKQSIGYTMLCDADGAVVERLGIRDLQYADGSKAYGVARPMIFIVDRQLRITHKFAEESYRARPDLGQVLTALRK